VLSQCILLRQDSQLVGMMSCDDAITLLSKIPSRPMEERADKNPE
jgi:hypothetical protein